METSLGDRVDKRGVEVVVVVVLLLLCLVGVVGAGVVLLLFWSVLCCWPWGSNSVCDMLDDVDDVNDILYLKEIFIISK